VGATWTVAAGLLLGVIQGAPVEARGRGRTVVRVEEAEEILVAVAGVIRLVAATRRAAVVLRCRTRTSWRASRAAVSETIRQSQRAKPDTISAHPWICLPLSCPNCCRKKFHCHHRLHKSLFLCLLKFLNLNMYQCQSRCRLRLCQFLLKFQ